VGEVSRYPHGTLCWTDLETGDVGAATSFYGEVLGWTFDEGSALAGRYAVAQVDGKDVAAIGEPRGEAGGRSRWNTYVSVDDLDATVERARGLGGELVVEPFDVGAGGREATVREPGGLELRLWQPGEDIGAQLVNETGTWTWSDMATRDPDAATTFCIDLFGWQVTEVVPGYRSIAMGDLLVGGIRDIREQQPEADPYWLPYFVVDDVERAAGEVDRMGGRVVLPVREVPAGRFLLYADPTHTVGALFEMGPTGHHGGVDGV
jgi:predicted enzyme related to lactoylglutathione lyase